MPPFPSLGDGLLSWGNQMDTNGVQSLLEAHLNNCQITVEGEGSHYDILVVGELFEGLRPVAKQQLVYAALNEKIAELADWEHYIATPRKQQLLADIKAIVETPLDNPNEQAEKVKQYRKTWNSLGHADDDAEQALNTEFNQLCETAFTPCRLYFAEQEKLRAQHLLTRQSFLEQAKSLAGSVTRNENDGDDNNLTIDYKSLENELNQLIKQWQSAGQIDREIYQGINNEFNLALQPIKLVIKNYHQENKIAKQALIGNAESLLVNDDIFYAVTEVKSLQTQWRNIGYAGPKVENKLW